MWDWTLEPTASLYHTANALEPVHPQFDYLKNTVSVVNDYYYPVDNLKLTARIYNLDSRKVSEQTKNVSIPPTVLSTMYSHSISPPTFRPYIL